VLELIILRNFDYSQILYHSLSDTNREPPAYLSAVELIPVALTAHRNLQTFAGLKCLQTVCKFKLIVRSGC